MSKTCETSTSINTETHYWTALTFAAALNRTKCAKMLLDNGANVEGGVNINGDIVCALTPLQIASANAYFEMVLLLLERGAQPFISTQIRENLFYLDSINRGCYSAVCVAAAHGHLEIFRKLLTHRTKCSEVLSLEDMLAECDSSSESIYRLPTSFEFNKSQIKTLQEAMYHSVENNFLGTQF